MKFKVTQEVIDVLYAAPYSEYDAVNDPVVRQLIAHKYLEREYDEYFDTYSDEFFITSKGYLAINMWPVFKPMEAIFSPLFA